MFTNRQDFSVYWQKCFFPHKIMSFTLINKHLKFHGLQNIWDLDDVLYCLRTKGLNYYHLLTWRTTPSPPSYTCQTTLFLFTFYIIFYYNISIQYIGYAAQHGNALMSSSPLHPFFLITCIFFYRFS